MGYIINYNKLLADMLDRTINVDFNGSDYLANYYEGDLFELMAEITTAKAKYPLIWLQSGYDVYESTKRGDNYVRLHDVKFFLVTKGDGNDRYKKRYRTTFNDMLYPLKSKLLNKLVKADGFTVSDDIKSITFPFNDMSENNVSGMKLKPQTATIDAYWDAVYLHIPELRINSECYKNYIINL